MAKAAAKFDVRLNRALADWNDQEFFAETRETIAAATKEIVRRKGPRGAPAG